MKSMVWVATLAFVIAPTARGADDGTISSALAGRFSYQGQLQKSGELVDGPADFIFTLWTAESGPQQVGPAIVFNALPVQDGVFGVELDFGPDLFAGEERWLQIQARFPAGGGVFAELSPRQAVTPTPYCLFALDAPPTPWSLIPEVPAGFADGVDNDTTYTAGPGLELDGTVFSLAPAGVSSDKIASDAITSIKILDSAIVSADIADGSITLADLANNSVNSDRVVNGSIVSADIADGTITSADVANGSLTGTSIADGSIGLADLAANSVDGGRIVNGSVASADLLDGGVGTADLANNAVNSAKIADGSVTGADIQNGTISGSDLATNAVGSVNLATDAGSMAKVSGSVAFSSGGNLGVGVTSPSMRLDVATVGSGPTVRLRGEDNQLILVETGSGAASKAAGLTCNAFSDPSGVGRLSFQRRTVNGDFEDNICSWLLVDRKFEHYGVAEKPGGGPWSSPSDARLKQNVEPLHHALERLLRLRGVTFEYIPGSDAAEYSPGRQTGFIAQDVEAVFPTWVSESADGYKSVGSKGFEALVVEAFRELQAAKDAEIEALRGELNELRAVVDRLLDAQRATSARP